MKKELILASTSPRRREILNNLGYQVHIIGADIDETPLIDEQVEMYVLRMAIEKNRAVRKKMTSLEDVLFNSNVLPILSADTTVALNGKILGKPESDDEAMAMLKSLSGTTHQVLTAICVWYQGDELSLIQQSDVQFAVLSDSDIIQYIASGEPMDKAGAYGIQGLGGMFIERLSGSFTGVMGLPVFETVSLLKRCGIPRL